MCQEKCVFRSALPKARVCVPAIARDRGGDLAWHWPDNVRNIKRMGAENRLVYRAVSDREVGRAIAGDVVVASLGARANILPGVESVCHGQKKPSVWRT